MSSVALETKGCREIISELQDMNVTIEVLCTDCNVSVAAMLSTDHPEIEHQHDLYHIEKRIRRKLTAKSKVTANQELRDWIKPVVNHLWWCAQNCEGSAVGLRERYRTLYLKR